jgi:hypothetical protein
LTGIEIVGGIVVMGLLVRFGFHKALGEVHKALGEAIENHPVLGPKSNRRALAPPDSGPSEAIKLFEKHVTMARGRAVRVADDSLTVIYARENKTKGRVKFIMDTAFDEVFEGDVGVLVIIDQGAGGKPFYKFIRDADIPTIDDVLKIGTGDYLVDDIYKAIRDQNELSS